MHTEPWTRDLEGAVQKLKEATEKVLHARGVAEVSMGRLNKDIQSSIVTVASEGVSKTFCWVLANTVSRRCAREPALNRKSHGPRNPCRDYLRVRRRSFISPLRVVVGVRSFESQQTLPYAMC
jgi:hypothetical protein